MRGLKHGSNIGIEKIIDRALDRAEYELERYCLSIGWRFDELAAAYVSAAAQRFGSGVHAGWEGVQDQMPSMRLRASKDMQQLPEVGTGQLALGNGRRGKGQTSDPPAEVQGDRGEEVERRKKAGWGGNELQRLESSIRRMKKRDDPMAHRMLPGLLKKRRALKSAQAVD